jgi:hypothetical protein
MNALRAVAMVSQILKDLINIEPRTRDIIAELTSAVCGELANVLRQNGK